MMVMINGIEAFILGWLCLVVVIIIRQIALGTVGKRNTALTILFFTFLYTVLFILGMNADNKLFVSNFLR